MKARPTVTQWLFLAFGAGLLAAVLVVRQRGDLPRLAEDGELVRLRAERQSVAAFEPAAVRALQAAVDALDDGSGKRSNCPDGWSAQAVPSSEGANRIRWSVRPAGTPTWNALVNATAALAAVPGNRIVSLAVRSRGTLTEREIASVEILLEQPTPTPSRRNPSDGTGWPGAEGPATPPAAGAGQASAPVRPAPRGPRAGSFPTHQPQPRKS